MLFVQSHLFVGSEFLYITEEFLKSTAVLCFKDKIQTRIVEKWHNYIDSEKLGTQPLLWYSSTVPVDRNFVRGADGSEGIRFERLPKPPGLYGRSEFLKKSFKNF